MTEQEKKNLNVKHDMEKKLIWKLFKKRKKYEDWEQKGGRKEKMKKKKHYLNGTCKRNYNKKEVKSVMREMNV